MPPPGPYDHLIDPVLAAIMAQESSGDTSAIGVPTDMNGPHRGARAGGGYQMMPNTARDVIKRGRDGLGLEYGGLVGLDDESITNALALDPDMAQRLARAHVAYLLERENGDPRRVAESWIAGTPGRTGLAPQHEADKAAYMARWDKEHQPKFAQYGEVGPPLPQPGILDRAGAALSKFDASAAAKEAADRLGLTDPPTIGEVLNPAYAGVKRAAGALGAATVEVPRMAEAAKPAVQKATYAAKDVLSTPVGEIPQIGASEAAAKAAQQPEAPAPDSPYAKPEGAVDTSELVKPKSFEGEPQGPPLPPQPSQEETLRSAIDALLKKKPDYAVQTDRWWKSLSGGQKAGLLLAAFGGGFVEGFRGAPNRALEMIQGRQAQDIAAQESEGKKRQDDWRTELDALLQEYGIEAKAAAAGAPDAGKTVGESTINTLVDWQNAYDQMFGPGGVYDQFEATGQNVPGIPDRMERAIGANVPIIPTATKAAMRAQGPAKRSIQKAFSGADVPENQASAIADEFMPQPTDSPADLAAKKRASQSFITGKIRSTIDTLEAAGYDTARIKARFGSWYEAAKAYKPGTFQAEHANVFDRLVQRGVDPSIVDQPHTDMLNSFVREEG